MIKCSLGIMAYNEEKNIGWLLQSLLDQKLQNVEISEIIVVASGCTDQTVEIAEQFTVKSSKVKVLVQQKREGKASAINLWLKNTSANILVMESADTLPEKETVEKLVSPFQNPKIGMTGAHPIPTNNKKTFMGYAVHLLWNLHHTISLQNPKMGEMVAFRKIISEMPPDTTVDEAFIEAAVKKIGYQIKYIPEAIVRNRGPETVSDFLKQRRRIHAGHLELQKKEDYKVATMSPVKIISALLKSSSSDWQFFAFTPFVIALEGWGKILGWYDWRFRKKRHTIWEVAKSTKELSAN